MSLSQHGSSQAEVIIKDVSAQQNNAPEGNAARSDAESAVARGAHHEKRSTTAMCCARACSGAKVRFKTHAFSAVAVGLAIDHADGGPPTPSMKTLS
eukprot:12161478-Alexandrium_andersonii.AAC.1